MNAISIVVLIFFVLGAVDHLLGDKLGIGVEFRRGFSLFLPMALSMLGMLVIAPAFGAWLSPFFESFYKITGIDASIIPASVFANDMGGMTLSIGVAAYEALGKFNGFVVSSMMGCVISFTIPFALGIVDKSQHRDMFFGFICGIATVPVGCFVAGLSVGIEPLLLIVSMLPLIILSVITGVALVLVPRVAIAVFRVFGTLMKVLGIVGLLIAVFTFLTKIELSPYFDTFENAAFVCANATVTLAGMLPAMLIIARLLAKPLGKLACVMGINRDAALALLGSLVTNASTFGNMGKMERKGVVLNSAFAVSASFVFGSHLAFTMAFDQSYILPMIIAKLISGVCAVLLAMLLFKENEPKAA